MVPKILDDIVFKQLQWKSSSVLSLYQHGFIRSKSTLLNLLQYYAFINEAFEDKAQVYSIYTDFAKAFDRVNHDILISKLHRLRFRHNTVKGLYSFLSGRQQQVKIGGFISQCRCHIRCVFIDDLQFCFNQSFNVFALCRWLEIIQAY